MTHDKLSSSIPFPRRVILDVRSPYEFRNGSHAASIHVPLSDLRQRLLVPACDLERLASPSGVTAEEFEAALASAQELILYCAAGYRSFIAKCLLVFELATRRQADAEPRDVLVADVANGSLQIMLRHAEYWVVKDRSVICIS